MKRRNNLAPLAGLAIGIGSLYALASYFNLGADELRGFAVSAATLLAAMFIFAALLVGIIKLSGRLLRRLRGEHHGDSNNDHE